jgi:carbon starvation protein CstA
MITLLGGIGLLILGYLFYGAYIEKNFQIEPDRTTPAEALRDGYDFVPMSKSKNAIIELLNIAGTGPIFGPIMGALYGPVAYIWIVFGCIFAGAVHDYMIGMISLRNNGAHLPELASKYLGKPVKHVVNIFAMLLLMLVATVFVTSPANLIASITPSWATIGIITVLIFVYYLISTILPIDKAMGKVYPIFGAILIISTIAIGISLLFGGHSIPNLGGSTLANFHPSNTPIFPALFFTVSCGALSGFHATQAPMVSRTSTNEREGRFTFYGMMIAEGIIAMIWAAASMSLFDGLTLSEMINAGTPSAVVNQVSVLLLGNVFGTVAIFGVIVLPVSSGLSAFRSLRTILADYLHIKQDTLKKILMVTIPLYIVSFVLTQIDFNLLWRYFNWANQVTAVIALLVSTRYLFLKERNYLVTLIPGSLMMYACVVYILSEPIGLQMGLTVATYILAAVLTVGILAVFIKSGQKQKAALSSDSPLLNDQLPIQTFQSESAKQRAGKKPAFEN